MDENIRDIISKILDGATCQQDVNARIGDIVSALAKIKVKALPGKIIFSGTGKHLILDWTFIYA